MKSSLTFLLCEFQHSANFCQYLLSTTKLGTQQLLRDAGGILIQRSRRTSPRPSNSNSYTTTNHTSITTRPTLQLHNNAQTNSLTFQRSSTNHLQNSTTSNQSSSGTLSHSSTSQRYPVLYDTFPCLHPINPHMRTTEGRLQTFLDNASIWPAHRIRATPQQIVDAGMYYLGERDRVKCWYCNGGLQNWERDDDPWEEHAKWFPLCEYVLQQKGPDYVHQIVLRFPGLRRPNLTNPTSGSGAQLVSNAIRGNTVRSNSPAHRSVNQSSAPHIVDPQVELRRINEQVEAELSRSQIVANAKMMGFSENHIKAALKRQFQVHKQPFSTMEALVDAVLSTEEPSSFSSENQEEAVVERNEDPTASRDPQSPGQELQRLEESRRCKRCHREDACVVFIPCGHLACCVACSDQIQRCPVCREHIREKVRSYLS